MKNNNDNRKHINNFFKQGLPKENYDLIKDVLASLSDEDLSIVYKLANEQIDKNNGFEPLKDTVELKGAIYEVITLDSFDKGLETSIFEIKNGTIDFMPVFVEHYTTQEDATRMHGIIISNLELFIN